MGVNKEEVIKKYCKALRSGGTITKEHRDFILIKELYHCSPTELDNVEENILDLHYEMLMKERERQHIEMEREKQRQNQKRLHK